MRRAPRREAGIELRRLDDSDSYSSRTQIRRLRRHSALVAGADNESGAARGALGAFDSSVAGEQVFSAARRTSPSSGPDLKGRD